MGDDPTALRLEADAEHLRSRATALREEAKQLDRLARVHEMAAAHTRKDPTDE